MQSQKLIVRGEHILTRAFMSVNGFHTVRRTVNADVFQKFVAKTHLMPFDEKKNPQCSDNGQLHHSPWS